MGGLRARLGKVLRRPPAAAVRELRSARRWSKGNYPSLGRVMVMMAQMMTVTLHPPTRQGLIVRIAIRVAGGRGEEAEG